MAKLGHKDIKVTEWDTLRFSWSATQSITNNESTVSWSLKLISGSDGRIDSSAQKKWTVTINGTTFSGTTTIGISNDSEITLASSGNDKKVVIAHNADGTKSFSFSFSQQFSITFSGQSIGTKSGSGSATLDTIPRKSTMTASNTNRTLGVAQVLYVNKVNKQLDSFTHAISYKCGSVSGNCYPGTSKNEEIQFTPPVYLAAQNTTGTSVTIVYTITTYNDEGTSLGTNTFTATYAIPESVKPSVSITVSDSTSNKDTYGSYVQGQSKLFVKLNETTMHGATIKSRKTTFDGKTFTSDSFNAGVISKSGTLTVTTTITDSRGRTATASEKITVTAYSPPKITAFSAYRSDSSGNPNDSGTSITVKFSSSMTSLNTKNTANYTVEYKKRSESGYKVYGVTFYENRLNVTDGTYTFPTTDTASSYDIIFTARDAFKSVSKTATVSSSKKLWSILSGGLGFAFNKVAETEGVLDIGFKTKFTGGIQNEVLGVSTDLNDVMTPNTYASINKSGVTYANTPITSGTFVLEVMNAGAEGQVFQRMTTTFKDGKQECFERHFFQNAWGAWSCVYSDTGWVNLPLQDGISVGSESKYLKGRLKNDVLYIKGDVKGVTKNWQYIAHVDASLMPSTLASATRFGGVYNMTVFCGMNLTSNGQLYVSSNSSGAWDDTKDVSVNVAICG